MKLSDLTTGGQSLVKLRLAKESESWDQCSHWWKDKPHPTETQLRMHRWYDAFLAFRQAVFDDHDIDEAFVRWVNTHHSANFDVPDLFKIPVGSINVPQFAFREDYGQAMKLYREHQALLENETDPAN